MSDGEWSDERGGLSVSIEESGVIKIGEQVGLYDNYKARIQGQVCLHHISFAI